MIIDGKEVQIGGIDIQGVFQKGDIEYAFDGYGSDKITFAKKGSDLKLLVAKKKALYEAELTIAVAKKTVIAAELKTNDNIDVTAANADTVLDDIIYPRVISRNGIDNTTTTSKEVKELARTYNDLKWKCKRIEGNIKTCDTLLEHLEDKKSYSMNIRQLSAITKGLDVETIEKEGAPEEETIEKSDMDKALETLGL